MTFSKMTAPNFSEFCVDSERHAIDGMRHYRYHEQLIDVLPEQLMTVSMPKYIWDQLQACYHDEDIILPPDKAEQQRLLERAEAMALKYEKALDSWKKVFKLSVTHQQGVIDKMRDQMGLEKINRSPASKKKVPGSPDRKVTKPTKTTQRGKQAEPKVQVKRVRKEPVKPMAAVVEDGGLGLPVSDDLTEPAKAAPLPPVAKKSAAAAAAEEDDDVVEKTEEELEEELEEESALVNRRLAQERSKKRKRLATKAARKSVPAVGGSKKMRAGRAAAAAAAASESSDSCEEEDYGTRFMNEPSSASESDSDGP